MSCCSDVSRLEMLQELNICGNQLRSLPASLGELSKLTVLRAHSNALESLPDFKRATSLRVSIVINFFFYHGFFHHVGSPIWLMIFLLHIALSVFSLALSPVLFKYHWHVSFHLVFGRPIFLFPSVSVLNTFLSPSHARTSSICSPLSFWKPAPLSLFLGGVRS